MKARIHATDPPPRNALPVRRPQTSPPRAETAAAPAKAQAGRRGVSAVEFAVIAPLFFLLVFGIIEFGRALMVQQILTNASREGARRAIIEDATASEVKQLVQDYLDNTSVSNATVNVDPATLDTLGFGDPVTVSVTVSFDDVSWVPAPWFLSGSNLTSSTVMRAERLQ